MINKVLKNLILSITLFFFIVFISCNKYPGFHEIEKGLYRKVFIIGDETRPVKPNSFVKINYNITHLTDTQIILSDTGIYIQMVEPYQNEILKVLSHMNYGDSACYIIKRPDPTKGDSLFDVIIHLSVQDILSAKNYEQMMADREIRSEKKEMEEIFSYLQLQDNEPWKVLNGMNYSLLQKGQGPYIKTGDVVTIHYSGYFLNGTKFDSTIDNNEPLTFTYGDPQQVLKGFELAISMMNKDAKLKIILPSQLAFGETGSSNKKIRPYTPLLYEIHVLSINQHS